MQRPRRIFSTVFAGLSLLLGLAIGGLWLRSYFRADAWSRSNYAEAGHEIRACSVASQRGRAGVIFMRLWFDPARVKTEAKGSEGTVYIPNLMAFGYKNEWWAVKLDLTPPAAERWWERLGLYVRTTDVPGLPVGLWQVNVTVPYWMLVVVFLIGPGVWGVGWWRRRRKIRKGLCVNCGYDLRASEGRCPECGMVMEI
jgi:hypothetical protein